MDFIPFQTNRNPRKPLPKVMSISQDWIFDRGFLEDTSSPRFLKCSLKEERLYRRKTIMFIEDLGKEMKCNERKVILTACVFFHRFYVFHSFKSQNRFNAAVACLFLASKAEEMPIKLRDIVFFYFKLRSPMENPTDQECKDKQKDVLISERILLQTLNFDLNVIHPAHGMVNKLRELRNFIPEDRKKEIFHVATSFSNDSYRSTICLQFSPDQIAYGCILLSTIQMGLHPTVTNSRNSSVSTAEQSWFDLMEKDVDEAAIKSICFQILDLYDESDNALRCELPDKQLAIRHIGGIVGSGLSPDLLTTPPSITASEESMVSSVHAVSSAKGSSSSLPMNSSYDNLYSQQAHQLEEESRKRKLVTVTMVKTTSAAVSSSSADVQSASYFSVSATTNESKLDAYSSYPTPAADLDSSLEISPMSSSTPSVMPPPPDTPGSDYSTFSQADKHSRATAVGADTPCYMPPPSDTPSATPNFDSCPQPRRSGSLDESFESMSSHGSDGQPLYSRNPLPTDESMGAPKRARID